MKGKELLDLVHAALEKQCEAEFRLQKQQSDTEQALILKQKDEEIAFYRDMKARMSTKMVGETLEQHCEIEFNRLRAAAFPNAYFEKDNDARTGSKGDYIFRDYDEDGMEYISIMFEMKNEMDTTATKHRNEDFFKELDKDRTEKGCEYAVLVTLLEATASCITPASWTCPTAIRRCTSFARSFSSRSFRFCAMLPAAVSITAGSSLPCRIRMWTWRISTASCRISRNVFPAIIVLHLSASATRSTRSTNPSPACRRSRKRCSNPASISAMPTPRPRSSRSSA